MTNEDRLDKLDKDVEDLFKHIRGVRGDAAVLMNSHNALVNAVLNSSSMGLTDIDRQAITAAKIIPVR
ncbi:MAG: hypothetical protein KGJ86_07045 [Chloroflexota bacterium]|nr:hypothetical protein [Chloroflexota bacterium]